MRVLGSATSRSTRGVITVELVVAMSILLLAMIPLTYSFVQEQKLCRSYYYRAIIMELLDGEAEALAAGEWRSFQEGSQPYRVHGEAAKNLPPGRFALTLSKDKAKLEWLPGKRDSAGRLSREVRLR